MRTAVKNLEEALRILRSLRPELERRFSVRRIGVFGSLARNDAREGSDVDILVEFDVPTFDHYMDLKFLLEEAFGRPVDLVLRDSLKPRIRPEVEREVIYA